MTAFYSFYIKASLAPTSLVLFFLLVSHPSSQTPNVRSVYFSCAYSGFLQLLQSPKSPDRGNPPSRIFRVASQNTILWRIAMRPLLLENILLHSSLLPVVIVEKDLNKDQYEHQPAVEVSPFKPPLPRCSSQPRK